MGISPINFVKNVTSNIKAHKAAKVADAVIDAARGYEFGKKAGSQIVKERLVADMFAGKAIKHGKPTAFWQGVKEAFKK